MVKMRQRNLIALEFQRGSSDDELINYISKNIEFIRNRCLAFHEDISPNLAEFLKQSHIDYFRVKNEHIFRQKKRADIDTITHDTKDNTQDSKIPNTNAKKITITLDDNTETPIIKESPIDEIQTYSGDSLISVVSKQNLISNTQMLESKLVQKLDSNNSTNMDLDLIKDSIRIKDNSYGNHVLHSQALPTMIFKRKIRSGEELHLESNVTFLRDISHGASIKVRGNVHIYAKCDGILESFGDYIIMQDIFAGRIFLKGIIVDAELLKNVKDSNRLKMITIEDNMLKITEI